MPQQYGSTFTQALLPVLSAVGGVGDGGCWFHGTAVGWHRANASKNWVQCKTTVKGFLNVGGAATGVRLQGVQSIDINSTI